MTCEHGNVHEDCAPCHEDVLTHDDIESMRGGGFVPDAIVDALHRELDRHDAAKARIARLLRIPPAEGNLTIPIFRD